MKTRLSIRDDVICHMGNTVDEEDEDDSIQLTTSGNNDLDSSGDSQLSI